MCVCVCVLGGGEGGIFTIRRQSLLIDYKWLNSSVDYKWLDSVCMCVL